MANKSRGEIATLLTIVGASLLLLGIFSGTKLIQMGTGSNPFARFISLSSISDSKLGIFILSSYSPGAKKIVAVGPKVIKVLDPHLNASLLTAAKEYKSKYPNGKTVLRVYDNTVGLKYNISQDPVLSAQDLFDKVINPALTSLGSDLSLFDYIETPNEVDNVVDFSTVENVRWLAKFWLKLAQLNHEKGIASCVASISVGGVGGNTDAEIGQRIAEFVPTLREVKKMNGAWCYHAYTLEYSKDPLVEQWYSLRYRKFYAYLQSNASDIADIPMILSEAGVDKTGNPTTDGWQQRGSKAQYEDWLNWFDSELKKDSYILGTTLFQIGDTHWSSFNLEPIADYLVAHIGGQLISVTPPLTVTPPPGGNQLSKSKLGVFIVNSSAGAQEIIQAGPRVIKVMDPHKIPSLMQLVRDYKTLYPGGTVLMRVYVPQSVQYPQTTLPAEAADSFFDTHLSPAINALSESDRKLMNYLGGTNYIENFMWNKITTDEELTWFSNFWIQLATRIKAAGFKPNFGEFYVDGIGTSELDNLLPAIEKTKSLNGIWSYHGYTKRYTQDTAPKFEGGKSLLYRSFYNFLKQNAANLSDIPMILTEGGVDCLGRPQTDGWNGKDPEPGDENYEECGGNKNDGRTGPILSRGNKDNFISWLKWYDNELQKDPAILGITLYPIGASANDSGNLEPIADWFAEYLKNTSLTPTPTTPPGGTTPTSTPPPGGTTPTTPPGGDSEGTKIEIKVYRLKNGKKQLWTSADGKAKVYIAGPTTSGGEFSVVMDVPTTSGTCQDDEGHDFPCSPGTILWEGAPRNGTAPGSSYSVQIASLPSGLAPTPYPHDDVTVASGATTKVELLVTEGTWEPLGYTNKDYQRIITQYANGEISPLTVSAWLSAATRVPSLQTSICYPPRCEFNQ
ncbi:hypothetical protein HY407_05255 [Candidatus Gottesmanbacteria bacterium]|nr:hypothetical protein [Candidatus Gottesmanbacteria bacterium]